MAAGGPIGFRPFPMKGLTAVLVFALAAVTCGCKAHALLWDDSQAYSASRPESPVPLPPDGAWVRYRSDSQETTQKLKGKFKLTLEGKEYEKEYTTRRSEQITLAFVGSAVEDSEPCRWVEIRVEDTEEDKVRLYKILIKEKALLGAKDPLAAKNVVRTWERKSDGTIARRDEPPSFSLLFFWTPGALKHAAKAAEPIDVDYGAGGRLAAAQPWIIKDSRTSRPILGLMKTHWHETATVWTHPDLPVGYARLHLASDMLLSIGWGTQLKLITSTDHILDDAGTGAQSELPDSN